MAERKKVVIRPIKAAPQAAAGQEVPKPHIVPGFGQLPLQTGQVYMTDQETGILKKFGWKEGDPIPPDFAKVVRNEQEQYLQSRDQALPVDEDTPPVRLPKEVDIDSLPPERQAALRQFLAGYKQMMESGEDAVPFVPLPGIEEPAWPPGKVRVTDSGEDHSKGTVIRGKNEAADKPANGKAEDSKPEAGKTDKPTAGTTGGLNPMARCPRCDHELAKPIDLVPELADKLIFMQAILGDKRFKKTFDLFGGRVKITLRSLVINEAELCITQVSYDRRDGKIIDYDQALMALMDYRLALALDSFQIGDKFQELPEDLDGWEIDIPKPGKGVPQTKLPQIVKWLHEQTAIGRESLWRVAGQTSQRFQKLHDYLESRSQDENFWKAIDGQA